MSVMRVCLLGHHDKHHHVEQALRSHGSFEFLHPHDYRYEAVLADTDHPAAVPAPDKHMILQECAKRGIPIILYPHGAMPDLDYDGLRPSDGATQRFEGKKMPSLPISLRLVTGEGHAEVARRIGCKHRVEVVGWTFSELAEDKLQRGGASLDEDRVQQAHEAETPAQRPTPLPPPTSLLFAPIHPWANGQDILPFHRGLNTAAYHQFLHHPAEKKTVRMYGADEPNGITERVEGVEYTQSDLGGGADVIDAHDAVISYGTFGYTALARGKPTAFIYPYPGHTDDLGEIPARRFQEYKEYVEYPASLGSGSLQELFRVDVSEWKRLFVGDPLDADKLCGLVLSFRANRAQRRKLERMR